MLEGYRTGFNLLNGTGLSIKDNTVYLFLRPLGLSLIIVGLLTPF